MDVKRQAALEQAVAAELILIAQCIALNRRFQAVLGTPASRQRLDPGALAAQDAELHALAEQGHVLDEELQSIHRAYLEGYGAPEAPPSAPSGDAAAG